ncbi:MAG: adenylate kinase [Planctomycetota bacterium]|nr:MAG: adenylate kinase [Planctomycetota bacterium]
MERVLVIGASCAGKTTFASSLAKRLQCPHVELDALYWGPNWTERDSFQEEVERASQKDRWVIEGGYSMVQELLWTRGTDLIWLDFPFFLVFLRAIKRTWRRSVSKEILYNGNQENFFRAFFTPDGIPWWVIRSYARKKKHWAVSIQRPEYAHLRIHRFHRPEFAEAFLRSCGSSSTSVSPEKEFDSTA